VTSARWAPRFTYFDKEYVITWRAAASVEERAAALADPDARRVFEATFSSVIDHAVAAGSPIELTIADKDGNP
jgi:hypothetical protein